MASFPVTSSSLAGACIRSQSEADEGAVNHQQAGTGRKSPQHIQHIQQLQKTMAAPEEGGKGDDEE